MKILIISILFCLGPHLLPAQSSCTSAGAQCGSHGVCGCSKKESACPADKNAEILFILHTDQFAEETSWQLVDMSQDVVIASRSEFEDNTRYRETFCVDKDHCYSFIIADKERNGLHPEQGKYSLYWNGNLLRTGGVFQDHESVELGACCTDLEVELEGTQACYGNFTGQALAQVAGGIAPYSYRWSTGATHTGLLQLTARDQLVSVSVTDGAGCEATASIAPEDLIPLQVGIKEQDGQLVATPRGGIQPFNYSWSTGATTPTVGINSPGDYTIKVTDYSGCTAAATKYGAECQAEVPHISKSEGMLISSNGATYQWYFNGELIAGATEQYFIPQETGNYAVRISNTEACSAISIQIFVERPNKSTLNFQFFRVWPNPTQGILRIVFRASDLQNFSVTLLDLMGQIHYYQEVNKFRGVYHSTLNLYGQPAGTYILKIESAQGVYTEKIILIKR